MQPNSSPDPKPSAGQAKDALNGQGAPIVVLIGEDALAAVRAVLDDQLQPRVVTRKPAEAPAQSAAQQAATPSPPKPELVALEDVPWEDRCAVAAARVRQMPEGRAFFRDRWRYLRGRMVLLDRPTDYLDEMLMMLGHRAGELVKGEPLVEQVTLDWISLWFTHDPPNRHRVGDAIFRCSSLRGIDLEKEISRLLPKVPSHQAGLARLLALIDEQIAQLENYTDPEPEPAPLPNG